MSKVVLGLSSLPETDNCKVPREWGSKTLEDLRALDPYTCTDSYQTVSNYLADLPGPCDGTGWTAESRDAAISDVSKAKERFSDCPNYRYTKWVA